MSRTRRRKTILLVTAVWLVSALPILTAASAPPPPLYQVTLPAADRAARTALVEAGIAIDAVGPGTVTTVVDSAGLARLLKQGLEPLSVTPLDFPPSDNDYHNYAEMLDAIQAAANAHRDIVRVTTAGLSLEGRAIPAVKISDDPDLDDPTEPAVLFMALTHAREHLTVEMALAVIELFTAGYGVDPALTNLVNQREIWVLPNVNPDGGEYDVAAGYYLYWRKNRRPNGDGSYGVDLNRNYGYRWGGEGSSPYPSSETYRGPAAFSEPETQVVRDFALAHPDITAAITFHTYGELILYPYGYTYLDQPPDMDPDDLRAFVRLGDQMASTNGYTSQQASDLYTTSGDAVDWLYGAQGIFAFTFEMYPKTGNPGFYPPATVIGPETRRNVEAVTYLTTMADNPRKVIGAGGDATPPAVSLAAAGELAALGQPITLTATMTDDVGVTLLAWQVDGQTVAMQGCLENCPPAPNPGGGLLPPEARPEAPPELVEGPVEELGGWGGGSIAAAKASPTFTWTPDLPGPHVLQALAFDAGGNEAASEPITITALAQIEPVLWLPDPPVLALDAPLILTFSRPITGDTLQLDFEPPLAFAVVSKDDVKALITHAAFRPATQYTLTLTAGQGPDSFLSPAAWTFWSKPWQRFYPLMR